MNAPLTTTTNFNPKFRNFLFEIKFVSKIKFDILKNKAQPSYTTTNRSSRISMKINSSLQKAGTEYLKLIQISQRKETAQKLYSYRKFFEIKHPDDTRRVSKMSLKKKRSKKTWL